MPEKKTVKKVLAVKSPKSTSSKPVEKPVKQPEGDYVYALGRRKRARARTRLFSVGSGTVTVNGKKLETYFPASLLQELVISPLKVVGRDADSDVTLSVDGGGLHGQAEAARLGIARALLKINPEYRSALKKLGYLTRNPREKERKKYGLKKARRAPQWAKR